MFDKGLEWLYRDMLSFFPENVNVYGTELDQLFAFIYYVSVAIFLLTYGILIWFLFAYRHQEGRKAYYHHGNNVVELTWTLLPTILFVAIGLMSDASWVRNKYQDKNPNPDVEVDVIAYQFGWSTRYPGPDGVFGRKDRKQISASNIFGIDTNDNYGKDDKIVAGELHLPIGKKILVNLSSNDVLHSFFLPHFRVKQDAVPGKWIKVWFEGTKVGKYELACAELCAKGHYAMRGETFMYSQDDYQKWLDSKYGVTMPVPAAPSADTATVAMNAATTN